MNGNAVFDEKTPKAAHGMITLILNTLLIIAGVAAFTFGAVVVAGGEYTPSGVMLMTVGGLCAFIIGPVIYGGLKILRPNEALVLTLFGRYYGTIRHEGFYFVNPFATAINPASRASLLTTGSVEGPSAVLPNGQSLSAAMFSKKVSLKVSTLNNDKQKINDQLGNPIIIGIVVVWKVVNPTAAVFNVDNYKEYLSIQCDSALRDIARLYPYDSNGGDNEKTLRGSSAEIAGRLKDEIQSKVSVAGLEIIEARIANLSYAPEIAAAMLQRQQAAAVLDARKIIVEGAAGMVEMTLERFRDNVMFAKDSPAAAAMVTNLMTVLVGSRDAQPVVNVGQ